MPVPATADPAGRARSILSVLIATLLVAGVVALGGFNGDGEPAVAVDGAPTTMASSQVAGAAAPATGGSAVSAPEASAPAPTGDVEPEAGAGGPASPVATPGAGPASPSTAKIPVGAGVRGVTDTELRVGLVTADIRAAYAAINALSGSGEQAPEGSDQRKSGEAVVAYINARGGIAGRQVVPVWYEISPANAVTASGRQQEAQRACSTWTEDNEVFAVSIHDALSEENMVQCIASTRTVVTPVRVQAHLTPQQATELHDLWYTPSLLSAARRERALVETLWSQGFFSEGARIGVIVEDKPGIRAGVDLGMKPALQDHGLELSAEIAYTDMIESPWSTYVLQLQSAGVTHVLLAATTGSFLPSFFLMRAAEDQGYRPRYGISSDHYPNGLGSTGAPREQLARTQGFGWLPYFDTADLAPQSDTGEVCAAINEEAAQPEYNAEFYCDSLFFLDQALERATEISPAGLAGAVAGFGATYHSAWTIEGRTHLDAERHDGASHYRDLVFNPDCQPGSDGCFLYDGPPRALP